MQRRYAAERIEVSAGRGRHCVRAAAQLLGPDVLVSLWGGTGPHIGTVTITMPRPGRSGRAGVGTTSSVYNFPGHRDEAVARVCAERIAAACSRTTVVVAGIHIDGATPDDIGRILKNVDILCGRLLVKLEKTT